MPKLSVVVITYNEEKNIGRCLESVKGIADEIVVIDSFSTDQTENICLEYGARFILHEFEGFVKQKNFANSQATNNIILSLDADEALSEELKNSVVEAKNDFKHDGYTMNRLTNYCGQWIKHGGWYPDRKLRLFDRRKGKWIGLNIHEKMKLEPGSSIKHLKGDLLHYSFYTLDQHIDTINRFSDIASNDLYISGKHINNIMLILKPIWKFIKMYILKLGVLDGKFGFRIARLSAFGTYLKYQKLKTLHKQN